MYSISQNLKNVLKNKIKILISPILYKTVDFIVDNLLVDDNSSTKYFLYNRKVIPTFLLYKKYCTFSYF